MNKFWLLILILISFSLRFYHGFDLFFWHVDEDIIALTAKRILIEHHPQLIGFPIPGGIYLGPLFYYLVSIPYFISRMNPFGLPFFSAALGAITTILIYQVGSNIFENKRIGLFASIIYCFSFLANIYSRLFDGLTFAPILALLTYWILYQNIKHRKPKNLLWLGFILLVAAQNEGSSLSLIALTLIVWIIYRFKFPKKQLATVASIFIIFHIPLAIFDLRHNFFITKSFLKFFEKGTASSPVFDLHSLINTLSIFPSAFSRFLFISGEKDVAGQILPCFDLIKSRMSQISPLSFILAILIVGLFLSFQLFRKRIVIGGRIILLHFLIILGGIFIYNLFLPGYLYEWILVIFFPGLAFLTAIFGDEIFKIGSIGKIVTVFFLILFVFLNLKSIIEATGKFGLSTKAAAVRYALSEIRGRPFYLDSIGSCYAQGYRYLFWYFGKQPLYSYADDMFTPTYYQRSQEPKPKTGVVMVNPSSRETKEFQEKYDFYKNRVIQSKKIGDVEVLIVEDR